MVTVGCGALPFSNSSGIKSIKIIGLGPIVVVKKRFGIQTFFSTTVQSLMPQYRNSEHYYEKRCKFAGDRIWKNRWFNVRMDAADRRVSTEFLKKKAALRFGRPGFG
jgi:hypothetical protein